MWWGKGRRRRYGRSHSQTGWGAKCATRLSKVKRRWKCKWETRRGAYRGESTSDPCPLCGKMISKEEWPLEQHRENGCHVAEKWMLRLRPRKPSRPDGHCSPWILQAMLMANHWFGIDTSRVFHTHFYGLVSTLNDFSEKLPNECFGEMVFPFYPFHVHEFPMFSIWVFPKNRGSPSYHPNFPWGF